MIKTGISIDEELLERLDALAARLELSRSRTITLAAEELLARDETRRLRARLDRVHGEGGDEGAAESERDLRRRHRRGHRERLRGEW